MKNINQLTPEEIDEEIERLQGQIQFANKSIEEEINIRQEQYWLKYKNELRCKFISEVTKYSNYFKSKIAFTVVCEKHFDKEFVKEMLSCFETCEKVKNWRKLHRIYSHIKSEQERRKILFFANFYRKNVLNDKNIHITICDMESYQHILSDFQQTEVFN